MPVDWIICMLEWPSQQKVKKINRDKAKCPHLIGRNSRRNYATFIQLYFFTYFFLVFSFLASNWDSIYFFSVYKFFGRSLSDLGKKKRRKKYIRQKMDGSEWAKKVVPMWPEVIGTNKSLFLIEINNHLKLNSHKLVFIFSPLCASLFSPMNSFDSNSIVLLN